MSRYHCTDCDASPRELYNWRCGCGSGRVLDAEDLFAELTRLRALNAELVASSEAVHEQYRRIVGIADALLKQINPHTDLAEGPAQLYLSLRDQISVHGPAALTRAGGSHG